MSALFGRYPAFPPYTTGTPSFPAYVTEFTPKGTSRCGNYPTFSIAADRACTSPPSKFVRSPTLDTKPS